MPRGSRDQQGRFRVGKVSVYVHHGAWWVYYRDAGRAVRKKVGDDRAAAERAAAQIHAQLSAGAPTFLAFTPISVAELRRQFLDHHEHARGSTLATVNRYRTATQHLQNFVGQNPVPPPAHLVKPDAFAAYLRQLQIAPNGHANTAKRKLRDKGIRFILETTRSLYVFAAKRRHLPPYSENPFAELPLDKFRIEDARPIFVFDAVTELAFLRVADPWAFPIHFTLAKTGLRIAELTHLMVEDIDFAGGWLTVRNKPELHWRVKTGHGRKVPLIAEVANVLRQVVGNRRGLVFLRENCVAVAPRLVGNETALIAEYQRRVREAGSINRRCEARVAKGVWNDAGLVPSDRIRNSFVRLMRKVGHPESTCPKSWRHTFATLLQDANVDPLVRQLVMGHSSQSHGGLGMTAKYTHTRAATLRAQVEPALRQWPGSLSFAANFFREG